MALNLNKNELLTPQVSELEVVTKNTTITERICSFLWASRW